MIAATPEPLGSCRLIDLPVVQDPRGDLTFIEGSRHVPFDIARVYYLYNVPTESSRGGHAHRTLKQVLFALSGSFRVTIDDGRERQDHWLRTPKQGLLIQNYIWREMDAFSQGAVCMVLASAPFDEADYIRSYADFRAEISRA
jgi:hypothetical protein